MSEAVQWLWLPFDALSTAQLYALLRLRSEVFVVEQNCVFLDMDGLDAQALHLLGVREAANSVEAGQLPLVAYARCFPAGVVFPEASIGRVVTLPGARGGGLGHALMAQAILSLQQQWGAQPIRIGAQAHLQAFYEQHGFADVGKPYMEDGIPHIEMLRQP
jgi:ElaA protein